MSFDDEETDGHPMDKASLDYQLQFDLPPDELLHDSFACALQKGILHQGRLYISQHYLCFFSNIILSEAKLIIRADHIEGVELAKVLIFPTAIKVIHDDGIESLFASFLTTRERCYNLILKVSKGERIGKQRVKSSHELDHPRHTKVVTASGLDGSSKHQALLKQGAHKTASDTNGSTTSTTSHEDDTDSRSNRSSSAFKKPKSTSSSTTTTTAEDDDHPQSTLGKLTNLLTTYHVSQPPRPTSNSISTPHGLVVINDNPETVLPKHTHFRHARTGSMASGGLDGPAVAIQAGSGDPTMTSPNPRGATRTSLGRSSANASPMSSAGSNSPSLNGPTKSSKGRSSDQHSHHDPDHLHVGSSSHAHKSSSRRRNDIEAEEEGVGEDEVEEEERPSVARTKSSQRSVALALKPRASKPRRARKVDSEEEEEEEEN